MEHFGGMLDVLYACSFGNNVLFEILDDPRITVKHAIGDGMSSTDFYVWYGENGIAEKHWGAKSRV